MYNTNPVNVSIFFLFFFYFFFFFIFLFLFLFFFFFEQTSIHNVYLHRPYSWLCQKTA